MGASKRKGVQPTHEWDLLVPLFEWPEQERYEEIRPLVLFDVPVAERAEEVGLSVSTLYRRLGRFEAEGMESLFGSEHARRKRLPPAVRRLIVDLKAEHPAFNLNEIANIVHACFGRKPDVRSVARVLDEEPLPLKIVRNYPPYREIADPREGRAAIVELRLSVDNSVVCTHSYSRASRAIRSQRSKEDQMVGYEGREISVFEVSVPWILGMCIDCTVSISDKDFEAMQGGIKDFLLNVHRRSY